MGNPTILGDEKADPVDELQKSVEVVRAVRWFDCIGEPEHWPVTTETAARLLSDGGQYDVDSEQLLDLSRRGIVVIPGIDEDGALEWDAESLVLTSGILEARRQWRPFSLHGSKFTNQERILHAARRDNELELVDQALEGFDVRQLLTLLASHKEPEARLQLAGILAAVLEVRHGVKA